jgi:TPR repeat protein
MRVGGNLKKAKFHYEAAAMLGCEVARYNLGVMEAQGTVRKHGTSF